jgi:hypothetical protein
LADPVATTPPPEAASLTDQFKSGALAFSRGQTVPVKLADGRIGTVPAEHLQSAVDGGGSLITDAEYHAAKNEAEYGGVAGGLEAAVEGAGRGVSFGATDPLAIGVANLFGGKGAGERTRQRLEGVQSVHPYIAGGAELVSAALPLLLSGGAAAPLEGAEAASLAARAAGVVGEGAEAAAVAREASTAGKVASGVTRALAAPTEAVSSIGKIAESAVTRALGKGTAAKVISKTAGAAVEGAIYNDAAQIDEDVLGDHETTGEKMLAATGHGFLLGGGLGGALTIGGELGRAVLGRAAPALEHASTEQFIRALSPDTKIIRKAAEIPGGLPGIIETLRERGMITGRDTLETMQPKLEAAVEEASQGIHAIYKGADEAGLEGPKVMAARNKIRDSILPELRSMPNANSATISKVEGLLADVEHFAGIKEVPSAAVGRGVKEPTERDIKNALHDMFGEDAIVAEHKMPAEPKPPKPLAEPTEKEIAAIRDDLEKRGYRKNTALRARNQAFAEYRAEVENQAATHAQQVAEHADEIASIKATNEERLAKATAAVQEGHAINVSEHADTALGKKLKAAATDAYNKNLRMSFQDAHALRRKIDGMINYERGLNPFAKENPTENALKQARGILQEEITRAGDDATSVHGFANFRKPLEDANQLFRQMHLAHRSVSEANMRLARNRLVSPSTYGAGLAAMAGSMVGHGSLVGGAMGLAAGALHHQVLKRGNFVAGEVLEKMAAFTGVQRATATVDRELDRGVAGLLRPGERIPAQPKAHPHEKSSNPYRDRAESVARAVADIDGHMAKVERAASSFSDHAPKVATAFQSAALRATSWLASQMPASMRVKHDPLSPQFDHPYVSPSDAAAFMRKYDAVHDPASVLEDMRRGYVTQEQVDALKAVFPRMYAEIQQRVSDGLKEAKTPPPYETRKQISILFGIAADGTMEPAFIRTMQAPNGTAGQTPEKQDASVSAPQRQIKGIASAVSLPGQVGR